MVRYSFLFFLLTPAIQCQSPQPQVANHAVTDQQDTVVNQRVVTGAEVWLRDSAQNWAGKRIGLVANHTSRVGDRHLADTLLAKGLELVRVFSPEHGFRGNAAAGEKVQSETDPATGLPIVSLYGKQRKPQPVHLRDLDLVLFDMQDVGSRHYTYASTLALVVEACAESGIPMVILDRPNPNGHVVDGPVLEPRFSSFIGRFPTPIAHGMTLGELLKMAVAEGWLETKATPDLRVTWCEGYRRTMRWEDTGLDWVPPSPNLPTAYSAWVYLGTCWLEGTTASEGRGTDSAFVFSGTPWTANPAFSVGGIQARPISFTPKTIPGKAVAPKHENQLCNGYALAGTGTGKDVFVMGLTLLKVYEKQAPAGYWNENFSRWAGNENVLADLKAGVSPEVMYASWQAEVNLFREKRAPHLHYPD